jgi:hypothetical protein
MDDMRRVVILGLALGLLSGCNESNPGPVVVTGIYTLQSINNTVLPFTFSNGVVLNTETLTLQADGSFTDVAVHADGLVVNDAGIYSNFSGSINFGDQTVGSLYQGTLSGNTLTIVFGTYREVFLRQ